MRTVTASAARTHLYGLLDDVERGECIRITRKGRVIASISGFDDPAPVKPDPERVRRAFEAIRELRKDTSRVSTEELLSARDEGRR